VKMTPTRLTKQRSAGTKRSSTPISVVYAMLGVE